jgi:hypothetical protein
MFASLERPDVILVNGIFTLRKTAGVKNAADTRNRRFRR